MKTLPQFILLLSIFILCGTSQAQDSIPENNADLIYLNIDLAPHSKYQFTADASQHITQELLGSPVELRQKVKIKFTYEIESNDGEEMKVKVLYNALFMEIQMPQGEFIIDTDNLDTHNEKSDEDQSINFFIDQPFYIHLSPEGKVNKIEGLQAILKNIPPSSPTEFQEFLNEDNLKSFFETSFHVFPQNPISIGDTWTINQTQGLNNRSNLLFENTFTLESLSEDLAWINVEGDVKFAGLVDSSFNDSSIRGKHEGFIEVDRLSGLILSSESKHELKGSIQNNEIEIPLTVSSSFLLRGEKL